VGERLARNEAADVVASATAKEALERAQAAGKLVEGRLLAETVLSEEIGFDFEHAALNDASRQTLTAFADKLKAENQGVYIEVQGHTDDTGPAESNRRLAQQRAEAVRDFLHREAGIPLHRLTVAAYGETRPVADNKTREGRIKNRRVVLVVLK
jgi:outer membrane protein OmpA-like peptidoglycan-associated protein